MNVYMKVFLDGLEDLVVQVWWCKHGDARDLLPKGVLLAQQLIINYLIKDRILRNLYTYELPLLGRTVRGWNYHASKDL